MYQHKYFLGQDLEKQGRSCRLRELQAVHNMVSEKPEAKTLVYDLF